MIYHHKICSENEKVTNKVQEAVAWVWILYICVTQHALDILYIYIFILSCHVDFKLDLIDATLINHTTAAAHAEPAFNRHPRSTV